MANSLGWAERPVDPTISRQHSQPFHEPVHDDHEMRIRMMSERYNNGADIWTGKFFQGTEEQEWMYLKSVNNDQ